MRQIEIQKLKREILVYLIKAFYSADFAEQVRLIPYDMRPKGSAVPFRCCIHKERAVLRSRTLAGLGLAIEDDNERTELSIYAAQSLQRTKNAEHPLTVLGSACQGCAESFIHITDLCQNCVAKSCINSCKFGAITATRGRAVINNAQCKKCCLCIKACPYQAIVKTIVPCENACPTGAIAKDTNGLARIDTAKCIACGHCLVVCPFGAIHNKSQLIDVLKKIKTRQKVIALIAPALLGQMPCTAGQLHSALQKIGFAQVYEVAQGAETTARVEAKDLRQRLQKGLAFMTTSCCAAYNELARKHLPEIKPFVSDTKTPLAYTAAIARRANPEAVNVFISPCLAKYPEVNQDSNVDHILTFEEIGALLVALNIEPAELPEENFAHVSAREARGFPLSGGVAKSVLAAWDGAPQEVTPAFINGLNKASLAELRAYAKQGRCARGNLLEIMCCLGGCANGPAVLNTEKAATAQIEKYASEAESLQSLR
ncbi:periplasmic Fe-hydrogenase [Candidatus Termititenax persephonae]|uniref:Periplasmic Fe-hydrogenase n=1 Tax=Candidatus Termititenax persephonae TaxID=2218525 RepID=A0A388TGP9_9BACT|nr:periplasmic Fe-hydrogenase [Candidatus Termititenax persephonae]